MKFASPDVPGLLKKSMRLLQAGKTEAERAFIELVKKSHGRELQIIESIPGIGESTAARLISSVGDFKKFTSSGQVVSYLGLSPTRKQSGTNLNSRGPISRMGGCRLRSYVQRDESGGKTGEGHHRGHSK